jgi:DNA-directed RNA polymerase subunit RPC12/RpoP
MATLLEYKCPACGGALSFDSELQKMKCPYCDTEFEVSALKELDEALNVEFVEDMTWNSASENTWQEDETAGMRVYVCNSCGGEVVGDETTAATHCPFCDNPVVMSGQFAGDLRPDFVIPFQLDKEAAKAALKKHMQGKPLLPKLFKSQNRIEKIQGVYIPVWLFNSDADANIRYKATTTHTWSDSRYIYTRTSHYSVHRAGQIGFDAVPVDGSTKMPDDLMESIEPYRMEKAVDFQTAYLAGYLADKYDVSAEESQQRANERIRNSTEQAFRNTVKGYSSVIPVNVGIALKDGQVRYALLPAWILTTQYKGEKYTFALNGQTGKFVGNLPVDKGKYFAFLAGLTLGVAALALLVMILFGIM